MKECTKGSLICSWKKMRISSGWVHPERNLPTEVIETDGVVKIGTQSSGSISHFGVVDFSWSQELSRKQSTFLDWKELLTTRWQCGWAETSFLMVVTLCLAMCQTPPLRSPNASTHPCNHSFIHTYLLSSYYILKSMLYRVRKGCCLPGAYMLVELSSGHSYRGREDSLWSIDWKLFSQQENNQ